MAASVTGAKWGELPTVRRGQPGGRKVSEGFNTLWGTENHITDALTLLPTNRGSCPTVREGVI